MEVLILDWYILTATGSVLLLTVYGALQYGGTLIAPLLGLAGDRLGHRTMLCAMRAVYTVAAATMTGLAFAGMQTPLAVFAVAAVAGLIRPSDLATRNALVAEIMPRDRLMAATGLARTTVEFRTCRRRAGRGRAVRPARHGAGLRLHYRVLCGRVPADTRHRRTAAWSPFDARPLVVLARPARGAGLCLGHPRLPGGDVAGVPGQPDGVSADPRPAALCGEGYLSRRPNRAGLAGCQLRVGSLAGSIAVSLGGRAIRPARMMIVFTVWWYAMLLVFIHVPGINGGRIALLCAGFAQSLCMVPMAVMLLHGAGAKFRGRVMGVRMLAIYGLPVGLLVAGILIPVIGFRATASAYCATGLACMALIGVRYQGVIWPLDAPGNQR